MKAVIFAAGLGTRLGAYTRSCPKALVEAGGVPMLWRVMDRLREAGVDDFVVNVHAFASLVEASIGDYVKRCPGVRVTVSDERDLLLETGGGLKKMAPWLGDAPFLVHNVDILSAIDLKAFAQNASALGALATLAVRQTRSDRCFLFNEAGVLCGWENVRTGQVRMSRPGEKDLRRYGFTGIHYICPEIFPLLTETGAFSITDAYLRLAADHDIVMADCSDAAWLDIGTPEQLAAANVLLTSGRSPF